MSIVQVAKLANVSIATVSRVINNHPRVAPETVVAVREAMRTLSYLPSDRRPGPKPAKPQARRVTDIGFLVFGTTPQRTTQAFDSLLYGASVAASQAGANLSFSHVPEPDAFPDRVLDRRLDGLLLHGASPPESFRQRLADLPVVWLMGNRQRPEFGDRVMPDSYRIGEIAAGRLIGRGHTRLAFLNLDARHWSLKIYGQAFADAAEEAGVPATILEHAEGESSRYWRKIPQRSVEELIERFMAIEPRPTGVFVADDLQASLLQPAMIAAGLTVGEGGIEIVSCNNEERYLSALRPKPVSIDIRPEAVGRRGVEQLLWRIEHRGLDDRISILIDPALPA